MSGGHIGNHNLSTLPFNPPIADIRGELLAHALGMQAAKHTVIYRSINAEEGTWCDIYFFILHTPCVVCPAPVACLFSAQIPRHHRDRGRF